MIFLAILRSTLSSDSAPAHGAPPPRTSRILQISSAISVIFLPILRSTLSSDSAPAHAVTPATHKKSVNNFKLFPPQTEVYPRLKFCALALSVGPQDLWNLHFPKEFQ